MLVFLDFEASSLSDHSYPIEVGWVFEDGASEAHLIRPAAGWTEWDAGAERIHRIPRDMLLSHGTDHVEVARRMVDVLAGHDLLASAPSWDGKWLSALLRAAGWPRHTLRLRDTDAALEETAQAILAPFVPPEHLPVLITDLLAQSLRQHHSSAPAHRALADAEQERRRWLDLREAAEAAAQSFSERAARERD